MYVWVKTCVAMCEWQMKFQSMQQVVPPSLSCKQLVLTPTLLTSVQSSILKENPGLKLLLPTSSFRSWPYTRELRLLLCWHLTGRPSGILRRHERDEILFDGGVAAVGNAPVVGTQLGQAARGKTPLVASPAQLVDVFPPLLLDE